MTAFRSDRQGPSRADRDEPSATPEPAGGVPDGEGAVAPRRFRRSLPLKFWFGPFKLWTVDLNVEVEAWPVDALTAPLDSWPKLDDLPDELDGIYRPSELLEERSPHSIVTPRAIRYIERRFNRRFIDLTTNFDDYLGGFSAKTRSTMRRKLRRFEAASGGRIDWRLYRSPAEMEDFHATARRVSSRTYQEKLFEAGLPDTADFTERMRWLAQHDRVRGYILFLENRPVSYLYLPIDKGRVIYGFLGFDPDYARHSPGTVLQLLALKALFQEGRYRLFDFTEGEGEHKRIFATEQRPCGNVFYLRPSARNRAIVQLHRALGICGERVDRLLVRAKLKARLKQLLRGQRQLH